MPENVSLLGTSTPGGQGMHDTIEGTAVSWLARTIGHCNPLIAHPSERMFLHKALLEMALLVAYRVRFDPSPLDESYQLILEHVDSIARLPPYYERVARDHNSLLLYGLTYAALRLCGRDHRVFRHAIQKSLFTRHCLVAERIPYRLLDLLHFLSLGGFDHDGPSPEDVFRFTILAGDPNIVEMGDSDVYAVTHTVFYLTDFGFRSSTWSGSFDMDRAVSLVGALLRHYTHLRNADLSAELIATSICLGAIHSEDVRHAWRFLHEIQEPDGRVPGPPGVIDETMTAADFGADYCSWKTSYHTTLVCALAGLMTRRGETVPGYPALQKHTTPVQERSDAILLQSCGEAISHASVFLERCLGCSETAIRLRALAGLAMCIRLPGQCLPPIETVKTAVMEIDASHGCAVDWTSLGADTLLLSVYALRHARVRCEYLESMLEDISSQLSASHREIPALPSCVFLAGLEKIDGRAVLAAEPPTSTRVLPGESAAEYSMRILSATGGDPRRIDGNMHDRYTLHQWLSTELILACREYRIVDASVILRMLILLGARGDRVVCDAAAYLISQQCSDGAFGFLASTAQESELLPLRLNWTLSTLWALADFAFPEHSVTMLFCADALESPQPSGPHPCRPVH